MSTRVFVVLSLFLICPLSFRAQAPDMAPGTTPEFYYTLIGGIEQGGLSSKPSQTAPFARVYIQSGAIGRRETRLWTSVRLLGAPSQTDTQGIFSVFADPTGQITSEKLSSVGTAIDFTVGGAYRLTHWDTGNSADLIIGFGGTTPLESDKVTQAFTVPVFGTAECNILYGKLRSDLTNPAFGVQQSKTGVATGSTTACLLNTNSATSANGATTYAPITTLAFSNQDRTSFLLKDLIGVRLNHTVKSDKDKLCSDTTVSCYLGSLDLSFGHDSAITGGVLRGNRWIAKADALYPIVATSRTTVYVFGSFSTRLERNTTDNTPLILQAATLSTVSGTGTTAVPNLNTLVLPLRQPDRDFYRVGVGIDLLGLFASKK